MDSKKVAELRRRARPPGLTPKAAAIALGGDQWGWTSRRIRKHAREGKIKAISFGARWYIPQSQIDQILAEQERVQKLWERPKYE